MWRGRVRLFLCTGFKTVERYQADVVSIDLEEERKVRIRVLTLGCLAAGLLIGAPQAMAQSFDSSLVVAVDSASDSVDVDSDLCMQAVLELTDDGYTLQSSGSLGGSGGPDLSTYLFTGRTPPSGRDVVTLYCIADIEVDIGDADDPGGPDGDGMGLGMGPGMGL
jgi:hypothetical protein